jgi:hypothetical protein
MTMRRKNRRFAGNHGNLCAFKKSVPFFRFAWRDRVPACPAVLPQE